MTQARHNPSARRRAAPGCVLVALAALAFLPVGAAHSAPPPPVEITADRAHMDDRQGVGTYTGNVVVIRGDTTLTADRLIVHTRDRRPHEIEAHGEPARLEAPDPETGEMRTATALRIDYLLGEERIILTDQARVVTATEEASGRRITYDLEADIIEAERGEAEDERVRIIIQPREDE